MKLVNVAAAVVNQIPLAWEHNKKNISTASRQRANRA